MDNFSNLLFKFFKALHGLFPGGIYGFQLEILQKKLPKIFQDEDRHYNYIWFFFREIKLFREIENLAEAKEVIEKAPLHGAFNIEFSRILNCSTEECSTHNKNIILAHLKILATVAHQIILEEMKKDRKPPVEPDIDWLNLLDEDEKAQFFKFIEEIQNTIDMSKIEIDEDKVTKIKQTMENMLCGLITEEEKKEKTRKVIDLTVDKIKETDIRKVIQSIMNVKNAESERFIKKILTETQEAIEKEIPDEEINSMEDLGAELFEKLSKSDTPMGKMMSVMLKNMSEKIEEPKALNVDQLDEEYQQIQSRQRALEAMKITTNFLASKGNPGKGLKKKK